MLLARYPEPALQDHVFDVLEQFAAGLSQLTDSAEKRRVGVQPAQAAQRAIRSTAYAHAKQFANTAEALLQPADWHGEDYALRRELCATLAEAEFTGNLARSQDSIADAMSHLRTNLEKAELYDLLIVGQTLEGQYEKAVDSGSAALAMLGIEMKVDDPDVALRDAVAEIDGLMGNVATLLYSSPAPRRADIPGGAADLLTSRSLRRTSASSSSRLHRREDGPHLARRTETPSSRVELRDYGPRSGHRHGHYQRGFEFAQLGHELVDRLGASALRCKAAWPFTVAGARQAAA